MTIYKAGALPFWAHDKPGPEVEWQKARERAVVLDELRELKDAAMRLEAEVMDARATTPSRIDVTEARLRDVDDRIDELRRKLGKPARRGKRSRPYVVRRSVTRDGGSYEAGGDGNGNRHVQACAPR